ncbi:MAG: M56 family metallopeptidase, partial [Ferruginibacter sp.]
MLPFFWYLLKVIICSGILFGYYWLFLRNKIFHQYNRFYMLTAMALSLLLPLLKISFWQMDAGQNQAIRVLQAVSVGDEYMSNMVITSHKSNWSFEQLYPLIYWLISLIFFVVMLRTLYLIYMLLKKYTVQQIEEVSFVNTEDDSTPFSFFKYIFWNSSIDINTTTGRQIFKHEVAHIEEKHTYDKFFVNITLIFCWCNPFFWLYRKELNMIHEFIADKKAVENSDTAAFAAMILQAAYPRHRFELANNFFYSPIKRRLLMLTKSNNPKMSYIARLMVLPLAALVFAAFTFKAKSIKENFSETPATKQVIENIAIPVTGSSVIAEQKYFAKIQDTVPDNTPIDPEKALLIVNGKIVGKGKGAMQQYNNLSAQSVMVKWLNRKEAIAKYGSDGADGACEVNYVDGAVFTTAYADADNRSIFYIGMENPVKIKVPNVKPEDIVVNITEGSISGINGSYIVRVNHEGDVTLTLSKRDGTKIPASFTVKAKRLPEPADPNFPIELRKNLTYDSSSLSLLKQRLIEEQQAKILREYAQNQIQLSAADLMSEKVSDERNITDR